jgi:DNA helicase II / ATP-dependent DNA helicase PcrA
VLAALKEQFDNKVGSFDILSSELLAEVENLAFENPNIPKFKAHFEKLIRELAALETDDTQTIEYARSAEELIDFSNSWTRFRKLGLGTTLGGFRNAAALGKLSQDTSDFGLTLSTVHTMKGLEKDIVFLIGFCEGTFPDYRANTQSKVEEERNAAFVAVTRARRWLYISHPKSRMMPWGSPQLQKPSRFLKEMGLITNQ